MKNLPTTIAVLLTFAVYTAIVWVVIYLLATLLFGASFNISNWGEFGREWLGLWSLVIALGMTICEVIIPKK